jgi:REP element-mobilizing transposase RayT
MKNSTGIRFRRHTRLKRHDYRWCHPYFVTICVQGRQCIFGSVEAGEMLLSQRGLVARDSWLDIPNHHPHVELDSFIVMPNHVHGILLFVGDAPGMAPVVATPASRPSLATGPEAGSLGAVIGSYKSAVTRKINRLRPGAGAGLWQSNYYDHIIRNDWSHDRIREYIDSNPARWPSDEENPLGDGGDRLEEFLKLLVDSPLRGERDAGVATTENETGSTGQGHA